MDLYSTSQQIKVNYFITHEGQKQEYMLQAMDLVNVNKAYFVINSYWANFDTITEGAKKTADSWQSIDDGKAMVFTYHR